MVEHQLDFGKVWGEGRVEYTGPFKHYVYSRGTVCVVTCDFFVIITAVIDPDMTI